MKIVALAGGVGGAKLADGLAQILLPEDLTIIVNTGDDFEHLGLSISPDLDTVCYTLAGIANPVTGWGLSREKFDMLTALKILDGEIWFQLGDRDLATHLERTERLHRGQTLSLITQSFSRAWGVKHTILPMSDDPVRTMVNTVAFGELPFQQYFVQRKSEPRVKGFRYKGAESAHPAPGATEAIRTADAVIICPSNPWVSIDPMIAIPGIRSELAKKVIFAVSPIIGGRVVKGPAAKMFLEMGFFPSAATVADHYFPLLSGFVLDKMDKGLEGKIHVPVCLTDILMKSRGDRMRLAKTVLHFIKTL